MGSAVHSQHRPHGRIKQTQQKGPPHRGGPFSFPDVNQGVLFLDELLNSERRAHVAMTWHIANQRVGAFVERDGSGVNRTLLGDDQFEIRNLGVVFGQDKRVANGVLVHIPKRHLAGCDGAVCLGVESQRGDCFDDECPCWDCFGWGGCAGTARTNEEECCSEGEGSLHETEFTAE